MATTTVQLANALKSNEKGLLELDADYCRWIDSNFREVLGDVVDMLMPPPEEAW